MLFFLLSSAPSLAADFRWVVYNNTNLTLKISKFGAQVQNKAMPYKYFWGADECVWIDRSNAAKKTIYFPRDGGYLPKGYRANSDVHCQLVLESYDC